MEEFINSSGPEGFIYVSFGGEINVINDNQKELRTTFFNAFKNTKTKFVWKWDGPRPTDMPSNVFTAPWIPQQSLLGKGKY